MNRYFDSSEAPDFSAFTGQHYAAVGGCALLVLALYLLRNWLRQGSRPRLVRLGLAAVLILCEASLNVWYVSEKVFQARDTLPLELCSVTLYVSVLMLLTDSRRLFPFVYFAGIGGALQAIFTPVLGYGFPHFRFIEFFVGHLFIILAALFMVWVEGLRLTLRSLFAAFGWLNALLIPVWVVNRWTGGNYMFVSRKPDTASLLDILGPYPWYLLSLEGVALLLFGLLYLPFAFRRPEGEAES